MKSFWICYLLCSSVAFADSDQTHEYQSGLYQQSLLELYTSEGCSSCPPAEKWIAGIDHKQFTPEAVVPLVFHVTYWDYLGWRDRFSKKLFDNRQRRLVRFEGGKTLYTPQFFLNGRTLRNVSAFTSKANSLQQRKAGLSIKAGLTETEQDVTVDVEILPVSEDLDEDVVINLALYENNIESAIKAGENQGRLTVHQFVVRELENVRISLNTETQTRFIFKRRNQQWSGLVVFVESKRQLEQLLHIPLKKRTRSPLF